MTAERTGVSALRYRKQYELDRVRGQRRTVPAGPAAAHVGQLLAAGATVRGVADAAGVSPSVVSDLARGVKTRLRRDVAGKLLAAGMADVRARGLATGFVPAIGARRRIQALLAIGWRHADITAYLAGTGTTSAMVLHQAGTLITRATHDAVRAAYDTLSMRPGPSHRTRARAAAAGYPPPLAWDDDTIDDPTAQPHQTPANDQAVDAVAVERALAARSLAGLTDPERLAAAARLVDAGVATPAALAYRLGTSTTVAGRLLRHVPEADPTRPVAVSQ